jgi:glyoxylase-like metal-dependent hydrolase (beta-lactamase superfamily II)
MLTIKRVFSGSADSNTYLVGDGERAVLIDAGADKNDIFGMVEESGMMPEIVILTHYHIDHIESLDDVREKYGIPAAIHRIDAPIVTDVTRNGALFFGSAAKIKPADILLEDGQTLTYGGINYKIIHTPGHTSGGICILTDDALFTGDTLFRGSVGRTDLGDGNYDDLIASIKEKILPLGDDLKIYPGHGPHTTVGLEKRVNPFLR